MASVVAVAPPGRGLLRILGLAFGIAVVVGETVGVGIMRTSGPTAGRLGEPALIYLVWWAIKHNDQSPTIEQVEFWLGEMASEGEMRDVEAMQTVLTAASVARRSVFSSLTTAPIGVSCTSARVKASVTRPRAATDV